MVKEWDSIRGLVVKIKKGELSVEEVVSYYIDRIERYDQDIGAFLYFDKEKVLKQAKEIDSKVRGGDKNSGGLLGIPIGVKDNLTTIGIRTTAGSRILYNYIPPYTATCVKRLEEQGAIIIGKLNMDEFAMGSSTENSAYKVVRNPWNKTKVPGGSSGGSAAAVAAQFCPVALGTDTGGSIRQPSAFCGVVGIRPTYGLVSRFGLIAFASSLDTIGPIARSVEDVAYVLQYMAGYDPMDSTSLEIEPPDYISQLEVEVKGVKVGIPVEYFSSYLKSELKEIIEELIKKIENDLNWVVESITLPHTDYAIPTYYIIANAEASSNLSRYDGVRYGLRVGEEEGFKNMYMVTRSKGFGAEVKRRIMLGTYALSSGYYEAYYLKALKVRTLIKEDFEKAFQKVDIILTPTTPTTAFDLGDKIRDPLEMYLADVFTVPASLAGLPAISIPIALDRSLLPVGIQLLAPPLNEAKLFNVARNIEKLVEFYTNYKYINF